MVKYERKPYTQKTRKDGLIDVLDVYETYLDHAEALISDLEAEVDELSQPMWKRAYNRVRFWFTS